MKTKNLFKIAKKMSLTSIVCNRLLWMVFRESHELLKTVTRLQFAWTWVIVIYYPKLERTRTLFQRPSLPPPPPPSVKCQIKQRSLQMLHIIDFKNMGIQCSRAVQTSRGLNNRQRGSRFDSRKRQNIFCVKAPSTQRGLKHFFVFLKCNLGSIS